ncbi:MurR/RpiR family transcriptional regulator [Salinarimonas ramus]|uniref:RpiR family transcriptional regulator n=1 Tax=Salinarimonas ramus TaxID=690164 RepID=A0A917V1T9_9HYPH|nr:MurR/RpiR family transcriptional regulator [Salinarimonas ramus]GGK22500.1 RpiR family transcriptional regulator [Salinarimonas ramus]
MRTSPVTDLIRARYDALPPQLKAAARFVLENPREVALLSTREQAARAGVSPAALTRLAQRLDLDGYDALRRIHAEALREPTSDGFAGRAEALVADRESADDARFVAGFVGAMGEDLASLAEPGSAEALAQAADAIVRARSLRCYGLRSSFAVAYAASYVMGIVGVRTELVDSPGGTGLDRLRDLSREDALLAVSVRPYARPVRQALAFARERGATTIAVTDDPVSPVARLADIVVRVRIETPSFFHAMTPAFSAVECLAALVARRMGAAAPEAAGRADAHLAAFGVYEPPERG